MKTILLSAVLMLGLNIIMPQTALAATDSTNQMEVEVTYLKGTGLTLTRTYVDGVCVGWTLKDNNGNIITSGNGTNP